MTEKEIIEELGRLALRIMYSNWPKLADRHGEDLAQEMLVAGWLAIKEYEDEAEKIIGHRMRSRGIDWLRKQGVSWEREVAMTASHVRAASPDYGHEEAVVEKLDAEAKVAWLFDTDQLTDRQKITLEVLMEEDFDRSRAARRLGVSMNAVTQTLKRVRKVLKDHEQEKEKAEESVSNPGVESSTQG